VTLDVPPDDLPVSIVAHATVTVDLVDAAEMDVAATSNCQGATFKIPIVLMVHSS
jgi:hypothetical protein